SRFCYYCATTVYVDAFCSLVRQAGPARRTASVSVVAPRSRYFARIMRAIIVSSLGFGGGVGLLVFIAILVNTGKQAALSVALQTGVVLGIGFGVFYAMMLFLSDLTWRLYAAKGIHEEIWELEQTRELEIDGTLKDARS